MTAVYIDLVCRLLFGTVIFIWNVLEGATFENEYPKTLVKLYTIPIWRFALLVVTILASRWSISVGMMMAFATFFYAMDMEVTLNKWA